MNVIDIGRLTENLVPGGRRATDEKARETVRMIIGRVREEGVAALRDYSLQFDRIAIEQFEIAAPVTDAAYERLRRTEPALFDALRFAADHIRAFAEFQKAQISSVSSHSSPGNVEREAAPGMFTGQRTIPLDRAAVYVPRGRYPLISTALMGVIPAAVAGVREICVTSAPLADGLPDWRIMAAASIAGAHRIFALGGAQAIAAFAFGISGKATASGNGEIIPRADIIVGPGNKYVAEAKRQLFGEVAVEAVAGPTDVLVIADESAAPELIAADLIAQAEHDTDARARALLPDMRLAKAVEAEVQKRLETLFPEQEACRKTAQTSLDAGGLLIVYNTKEEAIAAANRIAPEHLELQVKDPARWIPALTNYGSIFIGTAAAEALGDYSAGINHTLPTMGSSRFSGGLSVRHFLKIVTSLRCEDGADTARHLEAAKIIAQAEGLYGHALSLALRQKRKP
jgi:histidinol dehydrogenase